MYQFLKNERNCFIIKFKRLLAYTLALTLLGGINFPISHAALDQDQPAAPTGNEPDLTRLNAINQHIADDIAVTEEDMDDMGIDQPELDGFPPAESTNHLTTFVSAFGDWHDRFSHNMGLPVNTGNISRETIFLSMTNLYQRVATFEDMAFIFVLCSIEPPHTAIQRLIDRGLPVPARPVETLCASVRNLFLREITQDQQTDLLNVIAYNRDTTQSPLARAFYASAHYLFNRLIQIANM